MKSGKLRRLFVSFLILMTASDAVIAASEELSFTPFMPCIAKPANCAITSKFGYRFHPTKHEWRLHKGVDYACPVGTEVHAAFDGVASSGYSSCGGNLVSLKKGYVTIKQWHQSNVFVPGRPAEQEVSKGDLISLTGNTGSCTTGPHLHLEYWVVDKPENPLLHYCESSEAGISPEEINQHNDGSVPTNVTKLPEGANFIEDKDNEADQASIMEQLQLEAEKRFTNPRWYSYYLLVSTDTQVLREIAYLRSLLTVVHEHRLQMNERLLTGLADLQRLKMMRRATSQQ